VTKKGAFITLSRHLDAFCMLRNMVDGFVKDLSQHFPKGKLVSGKFWGRSALNILL
jgi:predicted RNA-binding protein with RPS1 domain